MANFILYYSATGDFGDWTQIPLNDTLKPWGLAYGNGEWMVKAADYANGNPYDGTPLDIYMMKSSDGINWSTPVATHLTALFDYSLSFCSGGSDVRNSQL